MTESEVRSAVLRAARGMNATGINRGMSGNVSARWGTGMLITPSAVSYDVLEPDGIVAMDAAGGDVQPREAGPSMEWPLHAAIYAARPDVMAIVHAHPMYATALACLHRSIPAFHYMVAVAGGTEIACSAYASFASEALAAAAVEALGPRQACLLANHGLVACAETPQAALELAIEVEALAGQYLHALQVGAPVILSDAEMERVLERFQAYRDSAGRRLRLQT